MINYIDSFFFKLHYFYMTHKITWLENNLRYSTQFRDYFYSQENAGFVISKAPGYGRKRHMITGRFGSQT